MNTKRRSFLKLAPLVASAAALPVATGAVAAIVPARADPMRGRMANGSELFMISLTKDKTMPGGASSYVSSHMERRSDGKYVMVYDRD